MMLRRTLFHEVELKERFDAETHRNAQLLTKYELYQGKGARPFLHQKYTFCQGHKFVGEWLF